MRATLFILLFLSAMPLCAQRNAALLVGMNTDTSWFSYRKPAFNSSVSDFGVTKCGNGYVFSSSRCDRFAVRYFNSNKDAPLLDLYFIDRADGQNFSDPVAFSQDINTRAGNEGPVTFSSDQQTLVFTGNSPDGRSLLLFQSRKDGKHWSAPVALSVCGEGSNYVHPCFAFGDSVLFFASDCKGGYGGMDIYYMKRTAGTWQAPVNAGKRINSAANETYPFCSSSGVLYFTSDRQGGPGGLDIHAIVIADTAYTKAQMLAEPINSSADDFAFYISENNTEGFFSSNRGNTKPDDDVYYFTYNWPEAERNDTIVKAELCFNFFEEATIETQDTSMMKYIWHFSDSTVYYDYEFDKCFDTTGQYTIHLMIRDSSGGDVVVTETEYEFLIDEPNYVSIHSPDTVRQHDQFEVNTLLSEIKGYEIKDVYFDFGNGTTGKGRNITHAYHHQGEYYPKIYLLLRNEETGTAESRCVVKKIVVY
jgi:hypothetical protein